MSSIKLSPNASGTGEFTIAAPNSNTNRTLTLPDNTGTIITSASTTGIDASALSTGTVGTARLGSGTANNTTYLRGDQTWATVSGGVTSLNGQTGAITNTSLDAIGSYIAAVRGTNISAGQNILGTIGETIAGSSLRYGFTNSSTAGDFDGQYTNFVGLTYSGGGTSLSGTWRLMARDRRRDQDGSGNWFPGLWVRIS